MKDSSLTLLQFAPFESQKCCDGLNGSAGQARRPSFTASVSIVKDKLPLHSFTVFFLINLLGFFFVREDEGSRRDLFNSIFLRIQEGCEKRDKRLNPSEEGCFEPMDQPRHSGRRSKENSAPFHRVEAEVYLQIHRIYIITNCN